MSNNFSMAMMRMYNQGEGKTKIISAKNLFCIVKKFSIPR